MKHPKKVRRTSKSHIKPKKPKQNQMVPSAPIPPCAFCENRLKSDVFAGLPRGEPCMQCFREAAVDRTVITASLSYTTEAKRPAIEAVAFGAWRKVHDWFGY